MYQLCSCKDARPANDFIPLLQLYVLHIPEVCVVLKYKPVPEPVPQLAFTSLSDFCYHYFCHTLCWQPSRVHCLSWDSYADTEKKKKTKYFIVCKNVRPNSQDQALLDRFNKKAVRIFTKKSSKCPKVCFT